MTNAELEHQNLLDMPPVKDWHPPAVNVLNMLANALGESWRRADGEVRDPSSMAAYLAGRVRALKTRSEGDPNISNGGRDDD